MRNRARGGELIKEARRKAALTQLQLARRLGTGQSVIVRWERGERSPTVETVRRCLAVCGFDLDTRLVARTPSGVDAGAIGRLLQLSPTKRLELAAAEAASLRAFDDAIAGL